MIIRIRIILHYLMYNMISIVRRMKMEHVLHLNGIKLVETILMLIQIFMIWNMILSTSQLKIVISMYKWLTLHTIHNVMNF